MPPRKNIIKSGNAGTSSKSHKNDFQGAQVASSSSGPPPLFPPGSKTPLALLYERCQKNGWEKPEVQTFRNREGFTGVVIVRKRNTKTSTIDAVRLEPRPPLEMKTANEAKHWAATYALYRFCNTIQLNRVLPEGPRQYWKQLEQEHGAAPDHLKWQYESDPFAAKVAVEERQKKAAAKRDNPGTTAKDDLEVLQRGSDVRMGERMREVVESAIKKVIGEFPDIAMDEHATLLEDEQLRNALSTYGFKDTSIRSALEALSSNSSFSASLLSTLSPVEAALEYLLLYTPEHELPKAFSQTISSTPFVSAIHSGRQSIQQRWIEERAVRQAGYPRHAVKEALEVAGNSPETIFDHLLNRLVGSTISMPRSAQYDRGIRDAAREAEAEAVQAVYPEAIFDAKTSTLSVPLPAMPAILNMIYLENHPYPEGTQLPPLYISSETLPAYLRLYLTSSIAKTIERYDGEGCCFSAIEAASDAWKRLDESGYPDPQDVIHNMLPKPRPVSKQNEELPTIKGEQRRTRAHREDTRSNEQVLKDFDVLKTSSAYKEMQEVRRKLPAWEHQERIIDAMDKNGAVIVVGETGCGKTTQVPQFILDTEIKRNKGATVSIIVTQPRRVSVLGVSARVSAERGNDGSIGYSIRGETKVKAITKILFCTTGVLLRRLVDADGLMGVSHIIVDEVHERSLDGDFLLLELKEIMKRKNAPKVVLMSATINQQTFSRYFGRAPIIEIPGRTFPVETFYLEDILPNIQYTPPTFRGGERRTMEQIKEFRCYFEELGTDPDTIRALEAIWRTDRVDHQLVAAVVKHITTTYSEKGAILIFMPGVQEIRQCIDALESSSIPKATVLPLHANLSNEEQKRVFKAITGRKIVVATNVAETSITIDDVTFVIDGGKMKENSLDSDSGLARLEECLVPKASANQRQGRAGRTRPGKCFRLYTRRDEEGMRMFPIPEIQRVPLENVSLQVKAARPDEDTKVYLSRALDPPKIENLQRAWENLRQLGAIDLDDRLTSLGGQLARIPLDVRLGKMLILGTLFGCLSPTLTIVSCLSSKSLFVAPMDRRDEANDSRMRFFTGNSDLLTSMAAFNQCTMHSEEGSKAGAIRDFCEQNFISYTAFRDINSLRADYAVALSDIGLIPFGIDPSDQRLNRNQENLNLIKAVIVGGLWPRIVRVVPPKVTFDRIAAGAQQRDHHAKDVKFYDQNGRVFLHPMSTLFSQKTFKSRFLSYFTKVQTSKVYVREVTEASCYGLLLFGGEVKVHHLTGNIDIGADLVRLKGTPRIGVLVNQLRCLLDAQMRRAVESTDLTAVSSENPIVQAMLQLITSDGLDPKSL